MLPIMRRVRVAGFSAHANSELIRTTRVFIEA